MLTYSKQKDEKAIQKKSKTGGYHNPTGIPNQMKMQFETLSGLSFDDVKVHYNSQKPAGLNAYAYTQGTQVFMGPGQEKHLGHELGHVVQQKQGRVKATSVFHNVSLNADPFLEREADAIHNHAALSFQGQNKPAQLKAFMPAGLGMTVQMVKCGPKNEPAKESESADSNTSVKIDDEGKMVKFYNENITKNRISVREREKLAEVFDYNAKSSYLESELEELKTLLAQVSDTCYVYRDLAHEKYHPSYFKTNANDFVDRIKAQRFSIDTFIEEYKKNFNQELVNKFIEVIKLHLMNDPHYKSSRPAELKEKEFEKESYRVEDKEKSRVAVPKADDDSVYCIYRSMPEDQLSELENYWWKIKGKVEALAGSKVLEIVTSASTGGASADKTQEFLEIQKEVQKTPLSKHLGNIAQAGGYGGRLVKFYLKRGMGSEFVNKYLVNEGREIASGGEGKTDGNLIGTKTDGEGGKYNFSFNIGSSKWTAILFLSAVEKYEAFDLRKNRAELSPVLNYGPGGLKR